MMDAARKNIETGPSVLIIGNDSQARRWLAETLRDANFQAQTRPAGALNTLSPDSIYSQYLIVLLSKDRAEQDMSRLADFVALNAGVRFVVVDVDPVVTRAVKSMKIGARDYLELTDETFDWTSILSEFEAAPASIWGPYSSSRTGLEPPGAVSNSNLQKLANAAHFLAACNSLPSLCEGLMTMLGETVGADGGSLYLVEGDKLKRAHSLDPGHAPSIIPLPLKEGSVFEKVLSMNEPLLVGDVNEADDIASSGWDGYDSNSLLVYPLVEKNGNPIGLFSLHSKGDNLFTAEDREIALFLASFTRETIRALQAQENSQSLAHSLRRTFDNMKDGIILLDGQKNVAHFNHRFPEIMEIESVDIFPGQSIAQIYDRFSARGDLMNSDGEPCPWLERHENYSYEHHCASGLIVVVSGNLTDDGAMVLTFEDVTKRKKWEEELYITRDEAERANRTKSDFLANISHELRTPLNAIIGFSEIMANQVMGPINNDRYEEYIAHIHESGAHLLGVINNLLDLSKVEAGKFELSEQVMDMKGGIRNAVSYLQQQADAARVELKVTFAEDHRYFFGDESAFRQILLNLISNAVKFTPKGGSVTISGYPSECGGYRISVVDTGIGMSEDAILIAFQPFGQVDSSLSRKYDGTGLGLPLTMSLIELHDGKLQIESEVGQGTEMIVCLPAQRMVSQ